MRVFRLSCGGVRFTCEGVQIQLWRHRGVRFTCMGVQIYLWGDDQSYLRSELDSLAQVAK